jgi:hypothetical protein
MTINEIEDLIECPCQAQLCQNSENKNCVLDELEESLNKLCLQNIVESRNGDNRIEFRLKDNN